jgi:peptidoglycan/LPS O-acetylase OafA/YrhL
VPAARSAPGPRWETLGGKALASRPEWLRRLQGGEWGLVMLGEPAAATAATSTNATDTGSVVRPSDATPRHAGGGTDVAPADSSVGAGTDVAPADTPVGAGDTVAPERKPSRYIGHRPPLDGVRGLAMVFVLLNHSGVALWTDAAPWLATGGAIGMDLFFVLSGVLVSSLLLGEHARTGSVDLRGFVVRRFRRIVPTLASLYVGLALLSLVIDRLVLKDVATSAAYALTFTANWSAVGFPLDILERNFGGGTMIVETLHMWTLAVEVHFLLMWSVSLWVAVRRGWSYGRMAAVTIAVIVVLVAIRTYSYLDGTNWLVLRTTTYSRLDSLLIGTLVGIAFMAGWFSRPSRALTAVGAVVLGVILALGFLAHSDFAAYPLGLYTVMAVASAAMMAAVIADPDSLLSRLLSMRWLLFLGATSYSIYLWHQPLFLMFELHTPSWPDPVRMAVAVGVALVIGAVSHRHIEMRFMQRSSTKVAARATARP